MPKNTQLVTTDNPADMFTVDQVELIKRNICPNATDDELQLFLGQCRRTRLDPFARQIYSIERAVWNKETRTLEPRRSIQVSIDGFRLIAERTGKYRGQTAQQWCAADGVWQDYWTKLEAPAGARVGVFREGSTDPIWGFARFSSYVSVDRDNKPLAMWRKMPEVMIAKCAEALALRRAFPQELSGLETTEEMDQNVSSITREEEEAAASAKFNEKVIEAGGTVTVIEPKKARAARKPKEEPKEPIRWQDVIPHCWNATTTQLVGKKLSETPYKAAEWIREKWIPKQNSYTDQDQLLIWAIGEYFKANPEPPQEPTKEEPAPSSKLEIEPIETDSAKESEIATEEAGAHASDWRSAVLNIPDGKYGVGLTLGELATNPPSFKDTETKKDREVTPVECFRTLVSKGIPKLEARGTEDDKALVASILEGSEHVFWLHGLSKEQALEEINRRFDAENVSSITRSKIIAAAKIENLETASKERLRHVLAEWENVEALIEEEKP